MHPNPSDYVGREQAYVKHVVLEQYLLALALKVGQFAKGTTLNYIDGFSGPWHHGVPLDSNRPTSPHVAMTQLRDAREQLRARGVPLQVRGLSVESDADAYARLETLCATWKDLETQRIRGEFEAQIAAAVTFAKGGPKPFAFVFIDPTGWKGFGLRRIKPLLRCGRAKSW
jgi:three-Cys-motif partner protein